METGRANRQAKTEEADGSISRQERVCVVIASHGCKQFGGLVRTFHSGHTLLCGRRVNGRMGARAGEGLEEAALRSVDRHGERTCRDRHVRNR